MSSEEKWRIVVVQPPYPEAASPRAALECVEWMQRAVEGLAAGSADLVLLPEYALAPGLRELGEVEAFTAEHGVAFAAFMDSQARRLQALVCYGGFLRSGEGMQPWDDGFLPPVARSAAVNRTVLVGPEGVVARYDKVHLPEAESDEWGLVAGDGAVVVEYRGVRLGFAVCFDIYFPAFAEVLAAKQVDIILHPSYQRSERPEIIRLLSSTRALDAGAVLVRSSYARPGMGTGGHSLVASPEGGVLAALGEEPGLLGVEVDPGAKLVAPASHGKPAVERRGHLERHRRPVVYRDLWERVAALQALPFPRLCAHRGLSAVCPENTLPAFAAALACGAEEVEFDLWLSRDGVPVVCHDPTVNRTTGGSGRIGDLTWEEIRRLSVTAGLSEQWRGVGIPRLEEVLELVAGKAMLNIHIKDPGPEHRLVAITAAELFSRGIAGSAYLAGDERVLQAAGRVCPGIATACLASQAEPARQVEIALRYGCERIQFGRAAPEPVIRRARSRGIVCNLFYADDPDEARGFLEQGIDVILTNRAHQLREVVGSVAAASATEPPNGPE